MIDDMCVFVYECAVLERRVYVLCCVSCSSFFYLCIKKRERYEYHLGTLDMHQANVKIYSTTLAHETCIWQW